MRVHLYGWKEHLQIVKWLGLWVDDDDDDDDDDDHDDDDDDDDGDNNEVKWKRFIGLGLSDLTMAIVSFNESFYIHAKNDLITHSKYFPRFWLV